MSKARELASLGNAYSDGALSNRNLIINGAMQVAQRGTSFTGLTSIGYTIDRMRHAISGTGTHTITQSTDAPDGFANSWKLECTTAAATPSAGGYLQFSQAIEGLNLQQLKKGTTGAQSVSVSFWVKGSKTGTHIFEIYDNDNTRQISKGYTINTANTWEYKVITLDGDTTGTLDNDSSVSVYCIWWLAAGSNYTSGTLSTSWTSAISADRAVGSPNYGDTVGNTFYITGVQLEVGDTATPFEHRSYGQELALCQRYYHKLANPMFRGVEISGLTARRMGINFFPVMRASPSVTLDGTLRVYNGTGTGTLNSSNFSNMWSTVSSFDFDAGIGAIGGTAAGNACVAYTAATGFVECYAVMDAEL